VRKSGGNEPDRPPDHARERLDEFIRQRVPQTNDPMNPPAPAKPVEEPPADEPELPNEQK
jgi:hypothetical protein